MIDVFSLSQIHCQDRPRMVKLPTIYFVFDGDEVVYIGLTKNLKARWLYHPLRQGEYNLAWIVLNDVAAGAEQEQTLIAVHRPRFNTYGNPDKPGTPRLYLHRYRRVADDHTRTAEGLPDL